MAGIRIVSRPGKPWWGLGWRERTIGAYLVGTFGPQNALPIALEILPDFVFRELGVDGPDRAAVRQSLRRICQLGLIIVDGENLRLLYSQAALNRYRDLRGHQSDTPGALVAPERTQASGITDLRKSTQGHRSDPRCESPPEAVNLVKTLLRGVRDEHRDRGVSPAPRLAPWECEGGARRIAELVESGRCPDAYAAARALAAAALQSSEPFGPALLRVQLPPVFQTHITPLEQIV